MEELTAFRWWCSRASLIFTSLTLSFRPFDTQFTADHESWLQANGQAWVAPQWSAYAEVTLSKQISNT